MSNPQGWGRLTINLSKRTLVICSWTISCVSIAFFVRKILQGWNNPTEIGRKDNYLGCLSKQVQNDERKVVGMAIWIAKLVSNCIENKVATFCIHSHYKVSEHLSSCFNLENVHQRRMVNLLYWCRCNGLVELQLLHSLYVDPSTRLGMQTILKKIAEQDTNKLNKIKCTINAISSRETEQIQVLPSICCKIQGP